MAREALPQSVGTKLTITLIALIALALSGFTWWLSAQSGRLLENKGTAALRAQRDLILSMVRSYDGALRAESRRLLALFSSQLPEPLTLDRGARTMIGGREIPTLRAGELPLTLSPTQLDRLAAATDSVATLFVRDGDAFVRIATSLKDAQGQRAVGTALATDHPAYQALLEGRGYTGKTTLFGRDYFARYAPITTDGVVIGARFVGIDFSAGINALTQEIAHLHLDERGYFFVLNARPGSRYGELVVRAPQEGAVILDAEDANGGRFIAEMLAQGTGVIRYPWTDKGTQRTRDKLVAFATFQDWDWIIAGVTDLDDFSQDSRLMRTAMLIAAGLLLLAVAAILILMTRRMIARPLEAVVEVLDRIGGGDYSNRIQTDRSDEIGTLLRSLDSMQKALSERRCDARRAALAMQRLSSALDEASTALMVADTDGKLIYVNRAFARLMHEAQVDIRRLTPDFDAEALIGCGFEAIGGGLGRDAGFLEKLQGTAVSQVTLGGRTFAVTAAPVLDADGIRIGSVAEWTDRSVEVAAEAELDALLDAVALGDFSRRLTVEGKTGFFRDLAEGMNKLTEIVARAIEDVSVVLRALARADLTQRIDRRYKGRFAELKDDSNATVERLEDLVEQIRGTTDAIHTAAREIAAGNADLSERTEAQASSLEETASSMEELSATVKQNAQNAKSASTFAETANTKAVAGGGLVQQVVTTMSGIEESSHKIADIIAVIDSIAFQTNILALNAAVEAARAGEQGRGFAVVANEVRTLAQRSSQAAREIKSLIEDSVKRVESGSVLVSQAGSTMEDILGSFQQVVGLVSEIAASSREQEAGISQVAQAVTEMDEMTQRNAALVEEAAAAAESLEEQTRDLSQTVSVFRLLPPSDRQRTQSAADEIDFESFVEGHKQWSKKLRRVVEGRSEPQDPALVSCDDKCALGQWIYGQGQRFKSAQSYEGLRTKHAQFHLCAGDVLRHADIGEREQAGRILVDRFAALSAETIEQIYALQHHCEHLDADDHQRLPILG
ncbi:HAMP domain-containing protein [Thiorhodococcus mannitoliphagus]|uniref:HAMP domain-containing protein n=1 Tax=Thiorhodococcus mannitoliphagus TaxID=329406 RepID=A0A6P1E2V0_9GAMM|nr:Cache 3/Cache 2 fusion domain-containing protein [Thiorhodococcus mannitoliphagus]NEX23523.1 HAMP domain-containing protein [Thiorhodococcus mannitoliphagus]